jgi:LPXTG-motif cell wall-anchored protein
VTALEVVNPARATATEAPTVERTARVPVTAVAGVRVGGITATLALPTTGPRSSTRLFLWLAAALAAMGSAYLAAGRKPSRIKW